MTTRRPRTSGRQATERADRKRAREVAAWRSSAPVGDLIGHQRHWWDGPPPDRLLDDRRMEAKTAEYRALTPA